MFERVRHLAQRFALTGTQGKPLLKELLRLAEKLGVLDTRLEEAIARGYETENMVDIELAKELFHARLRRLPKEALRGWDAHTVFTDTTVARPGRR